MRVAVVQVGVVGMPVHQRLMPVPVAVRFPARIVRPVGVPMVLVVNVPVRVLHELVPMLVLVPLGEMQPEADRHEASRDKQAGRQRLVEQQHGQHGADEGSQGGVGAGPRRPPRDAAAPPRTGQG